MKSFQAADGVFGPLQYHFTTIIDDHPHRCWTSHETTWMKYLPVAARKWSDTAHFNLQLAIVVCVPFYISKLARPNNVIIWHAPPSSRAQSGTQLPHLPMRWRGLC